MVNYRKVTQDDIDLLTDFRLGMFRDMGRIRDETQAAALVSESKTYFQSVFGTDRLLALIAEMDGAAVAAGILAVTHGAPKPGNLSGIEGYIYNLYTLPERRNQGIGSELFNRLLAIAKERNIKYCWLFATQDGRPIYARRGFVPITTAMKRTDES
jgi:ribosomal protein S18 acetylase RimI-like enzyme